MISLACGGSDPPEPSNQTGGGAGMSGSAGSGTSGSGGAAAGTGGAPQAGAGGAPQAGAGNGPVAGSAGSVAGGGGSAGSAAGAGPGGAGSGGSAAGGSGGGDAGSAGSGGAGNGGSGGDTGGSGGSSGSNGGWSCPSGLSGTPTIGTPARIASVPPPDEFNMDNGNFGNVEGPVWLGDALYVSEMSYQAYDQQNQNVKKSRVLKVTSTGETSIQIADSGSNGLATDGTDLLAAVHKDGSITRYTLSGGASVISGMFMNARFNSPNDLALHSNGTIYFTDPNFQAPNSLPQAQTRAYRIPAGGGEPEPIPNAQSPDQFGNPNGITLSLAEDYLYVAAATGRRYPVMNDGTLGAGEDFPAATGGDGMVIDCAGNLYVTKSNSANVVIYDPSGTQIGMVTVSDVQAVTNVAFGGADRKTLYITGLGNNKGLFSATASIPGRPY